MSRTYRFHLEGHLDKEWSVWLNGGIVEHHADGTTIVTQEAQDQAALFGLLIKIRDLGLPLISIIQFERSKDHQLQGERNMSEYGNKIYEDNYQIIYKTGSEPVLTLYWKPETQSMNYPQFQGCLFIFAGSCVEHQSPLAIIDSGEFNAVGALLDPGTTEMKMDKMWRWRSEEISPVYNNAGIRKFAFTRGPEGEMFGYDEQRLPNENFVTKVCKSPDECFTWLRS